MPVGSLGRAILGAWVLIALTACSDDDPDTSDASTDASADGSAGSGGNMIPRRDAGMQTTDPIQVCDRADPSSCPAGMDCDLLYRVFPGTNGFSVYAGCVEPARERDLGDPCDPDPTSTTPYMTEGLTDLVFRDACGPGLTCGADPTVKDGASCRPICQRGSEGEAPLACETPNTYCVGAQALLEYCRQAEGCDVTGQTGCRTGEVCYLRTNDTLSAILGVCLPPRPMMAADGDACMFINECRPGSSCMGPISVAPRSWEDEDYQCRAVCSTSGSDDDAGVDDAGVDLPGGACAAGTTCSTFADKGLDLSGLSKPPYGQCD
jgi:hypothetical protein